MSGASAAAATATSATGTTRNEVAPLIEPECLPEVPEVPVDNVSEGSGNPSPVHPLSNSTTPKMSALNHIFCVLGLTRECRLFLTEGTWIAGDKTGKAFVELLIIGQGAKARRIVAIIVLRKGFAMSRLQTSFEITSYRTLTFKTATV